MNKRVEKAMMSVNKRERDSYTREPKMFKTLFKAQMESIKDEFEMRNAMQAEPFDLEKVKIQRELSKL